MAKISKDRKRELVRVKLSQIILQESSDPRFEGVTVSSLKLSPDGSSATVFFSAFTSKQSPEALAEALNHSAGFFSSKLGQTLQTRNTPKLHFVYDPGFDHSDKIDSLLKANGLSIDPSDPKA